MDAVSCSPSLILLAAGNGRRMGGPKALLRYDDGSALLTRQVETMLRAAASRGADGGVIVVVGAAADEARTLIPGDARIVRNPHPEAGLSTSLQAGLTAVPSESVAAIIGLLDLPDVPAEAFGRLIDAADREALARAHWNRVPGHPVLIGREHFAEAFASSRGDEGLRTMLARHVVKDIECADLLPPALEGLIDIDTPEAAADRGLHLDGNRP